MENSLFVLHVVVDGRISVLKKTFNTAAHLLLDGVVQGSETVPVTNVGILLLLVDDRIDGLDELSHGGSFVEGADAPRIVRAGDAVTDVLDDGVSVGREKKLPVVGSRSIIIVTF